MFKYTHAFSGFSVNNMTQAKEFYSQTLGIEVEDGPMGLSLKIAGSNPIFVYEKDNHTPASYTILNFPVDDINQAVSDLKAKGVTFEQYENLTDENNIARGKENNNGPDIAWFKDPAGNTLSVLNG